MTKRETKKLVTVETVGPIDELGGISGPILNPCPIGISAIVRMITAHRKVYEVNPSNPDQKVLLTLQNVRTVNFPNQKKVVKANVAPNPTMSNTTKTDKQNKAVATKTDKDVKSETSADVTSSTKSDFTKK